MQKPVVKFKEWFNAKLEVGSFPYLVNQEFIEHNYDYVINVSDEYYPEHHLPIIIAGCKSFWFPMNERKKDIGLNSIYGAMVILYNAEIENKSVYLHCHQGVHRSRTVQNCYYLMRTGDQQVMKSQNYIGYINKLVADCQRGYLPPKAEMESFLNELAIILKKLKEPNYKNLMAGSLDDCKMNNIKNF
jgi:hypothetical protein